MSAFAGSLRRFALIAVVVLAVRGLPAEPEPAGLPMEVTLTQTARFELLRDGKAGGSVSLPPGEKLAVLDVAGDYVLVHYRNLNGRVLASDTDLPHRFIVPAATLAAPAPSPAVAVAVAVAAPPAPEPAASVKPAPAAGDSRPAAYVPATAMERLLAGKLVHLDGGMLRAFAPARLAKVKFYALYFSASWCGPCQAFTPDLIDAYGKIRAMYPEFELVLVNRDRSPAEMFAYMRDDKMPWPALRWDDIRGADAINHYAGEGIPDLVLVDAAGNVLSDSFHWGSYVGPDSVVDDTWKILRDYRRKNLRPKS